MPEVKNKAGKTVHYPYTAAGKKKAAADKAAMVKKAKRKENVRKGGRVSKLATATRK